MDLDREVEVTTEMVQVWDGGPMGERSSSRDAPAVETISVAYNIPAMLETCMHGFGVCADFIGLCWDTRYWALSFLD